MKNNRYLNVILTILTVVLTLNLWVSTTRGPVWESEAYGQGIPDAGAQRKKIVDELKLLNQRTQKLTQLLQSGKVRVQVNANQDKD